MLPVLLLLQASQENRCLPLQPDRHFHGVFYFVRGQARDATNCRDGKDVPSRAAVALHKDSSGAERGALPTEARARTGVIPDRDTAAYKKHDVDDKKRGEANGDQDPGSNSPGPGVGPVRRAIDQP